MALFEQISEDIKKAMLARNKVELEALRGIKKELLEAKTSKEAAASGKKYSDGEEPQEVEPQHEAVKDTPKYPWQPKPVDLMEDFKDKLYGTASKDESKVSISLDQIDDDDDMLRYMETVPAIKRN